MSSPTAAESSPSQAQPRAPSLELSPLVTRVLLLAFLAFLYFPGLGSSASGTHPDEYYYLGISAEMDARNDWLTPTLDGKPLWFKPPLLYWAQRICYGILGRTLLAARLPAALAAIALALLTGALARRMYGRRAEVPAALLIASTFGLLKFGRMAMMDAPMALSFTAVAYGAWRAAEEDSRPHLLWAGLGAGTSFLLKGPVGAVIVLILAGGFLALRSPKLLLCRWTGAAFALGAAIGIPWFAASFLVHGRKFYDFFVVQQNYDRFMHPWTMYAEWILLAGFLIFLLPWTPLFLAALPDPRRLRADPGALLPVIWIAAVLATFTVPSLKWPHYGLSSAPAVALLIARRMPSRSKAEALITSALLAILALTSAAALRWQLPPASLAALAAAACLFGAGAVAMARGHLGWAAGTSGLAAALALGWVIPLVNHPALPPDASAALAKYPLVVVREVPPSGAPPQAGSRRRSTRWSWCARSRGSSHSRWVDRSTGSRAMPTSRRPSPRAARSSSRSRSCAASPALCATTSSPCFAGTTSRPRSSPSASGGRGATATRA